jgi:1-deoxy-D-xylulose-5-phosphate synthase
VTFRKLDLYNEMSISPDVGALSEWFTKKFASRTFNSWRRTVKEILQQVPKGTDAIRVIRYAIKPPRRSCRPGSSSRGWGSSTWGRWTVTMSST